MKIEEFIDKLVVNGWEGVHDAQHTEIKKLWCELFPHSAKLEDEINELKEDLSFFFNESL